MIGAYQQILRDVVAEDMPLEDVLLRALVLHTHSVALGPNVDLDDVRRNAEQRLVLAPLTRTHLAALLASWCASAHGK